MKKAFTLIELLIVMVILGILTLVLFSAYNKISEISFRVEQERKVNEELLFLSEVLQNFANRNSIDFDKYIAEDISLTNSNWFTDKLFLSWDDGQFSIYTSWSCAAYTIVPDKSQLDSGCSFYLQNDELYNNPVKLTSDSIYFTDARFKVIPYSDKYFATENAATCNTNYFACVNDDGFWLFTDIYPKFYNTWVWSNNIHVLVQHFFNI